MSDVRASELREGDTYVEYGDDDAVTIAVLDYHGDRVLVTGIIDGGDVVLRSYDSDEVVDRISKGEPR